MLSVSFLWSFSWAVQDIIILWGDKWPHIHIEPLPGLPTHTAASSRLSRSTFILLHFYGGSTSLVGLLPLEDHAIVNEQSNGWSWYWRLKSQVLLRPVGHLSRHSSTRWLPPRLSLIELRVPPITPTPKLVVAFICRALRFLSTPPPLARKALICK